MLRAIYAGSFDPPTLGHENVIEQALDICDHLTIAFAHNPTKKNTFSLSDRMNALMTSIPDNRKADVLPYPIGDELLVDLALARNIRILIRGIRNVNDYEYERSMALVNRQINSSVMTIFLMPPADLAEISSSLVKGLVGLAGWREIVGKYVSAGVMPLLEQLAASKDLAKSQNSM